MATLRKIKIGGVTYDLPSGGGGAVTSVNGKTGVVVLDASDVNALPASTSIPTKTSDLTNDSGFITKSVNDLTNYYTKTSTDTLLGAKAPDKPTFSQAATRENLNGSNETTATLFGKIKKWLADLKNVAFTGSYNDLSDTPTIPAAPVQSDWNQSNTAALDFIKNKPNVLHVRQISSDVQTTNNNVPILTSLNNTAGTLDGNVLRAMNCTINPATAELTITGLITNTINGKAVGNSPEFTDTQSDWNASSGKAAILNKPTIPTVNNAKLIIKRNNTEVAQFTANQSGNDVTANITVPTKTSDLTNDSNYVADASYVHTDSNYTANEKTKLSGIATGAEVNQNAFSNVKVGSTTIQADSKTDTLELVAGANITLTPNANTDKIEIAATGSGGGGLPDIGQELHFDILDSNDQDIGSFIVDAKKLYYETIINGLPRFFKFWTNESDGKIWLSVDRIDESALWKTLWTNSSPTSSFAAQAITLSETIANFSYYEILFKVTSDTSRMASTGRIKKAYGAFYSFATAYNYVRTTEAPSGTSMTINACVRRTSYGGSATTNQNSYLIPIEVIGWY